MSIEATEREPACHRCIIVDLQMLLQSKAASTWGLCAFLDELGTGLYYKKRITTTTWTNSDGDETGTTVETSTVEDPVAVFNEATCNISSDTTGSAGVGALHPSSVVTFEEEVSPDDICDAGDDAIAAAIYADEDPKVPILGGSKQWLDITPHAPDDISLVEAQNYFSLDNINRTAFQYKFKVLASRVPFTITWDEVVYTVSTANVRTESTRSPKTFQFGAGGDDADHDWISDAWTEVTATHGTVKTMENLRYEVLWIDP